MEEVTIAVGAPAPDGRGTCTLSGPIDIPEEFLWKRLIHKVYYFEEYITTAEIKLTELPDGRLYRNMVIDDPVRAPKMGRTRVIDVFTVDKEAGVLKSQELDTTTEQPTGDTRYNILHRNPLRIEYSTLSPEGVKRPLSNGGPIKQQIREAYDAWQKRVQQTEAGNGGDESPQTGSGSVPEKGSDEKVQDEEGTGAGGERKSPAADGKAVKRPLENGGGSQPGAKRVVLEKLLDDDESDRGDGRSTFREGSSAAGGADVAQKEKASSLPTVEDIHQSTGSLREIAGTEKAVSSQKAKTKGEDRRAVGKKDEGAGVGKLSGLETQNVEQ